MSTRKPAILDVDITVVREVLERARAALSLEDHAYLEGMVQTLIDLSKLVRERGTTIARLRRLFGLASSEKTADVFPNGAPAGAAQPGSDDAAANASDDGPDASVGASAADDDHVGAADADADKSARKGHGRIGASAYSNARLISVEHATLHPGDA